MACVLTTAFRFLALGDGFPNDHFVYISGGWQMLFGEWPTRDWVDPGLPLMFAASALAQAMFGKVLFAEALLVSFAFGLAAALTVAAVVELTGDLRLAVAATLLEVIVFPRTYGYPKMLVYAAAFLLFARYVNRPGMGRAAAMAAAVVIAFLFRHDHGIFLGLGGALTILLAPEPDGWRARLRSMAMFVGLGVLLTVPYLVYVEANGGLQAYFRAGIDFSRREAARQWHVWPAVFGDVEPLASALVYEFYAIPAIAVGVLLALHRHASIGRFAAQVLPVASVAVMANYNFIRDPLITRLPDAIVPAVILGAWLAQRALRATRWKAVALPALALSLLLFSASTVVAGDIVSNIDRTGLQDQWEDVPRLFRERTEALHWRFAERQIPTRATGRLLPFFAYVDRCTTRAQRLLVGGYLVELPFFAQRPFAAGMGYLGGSFVGEETERLAMRRLRTQDVPFAVMPSDYAEDLDGRFPAIAAYLRARYMPLTTVPVTDELEVRILVDGAMTPRGRDNATGWPCFN